MRTTIDAVFTVAVGAVCACALTLGPVPVNTVAATGALSAESGLNAHDAAAQSTVDSPQVLPSESPEGMAGTSDDASAEDETDAAPPAPAAPAPPPAAPGAAAKKATPETPSKRQPAPDTARELRADASVYNPTAIKFAVDPIAATIITVNTIRAASGLAPLIDSAACADATPYAEVQLTPGGTLPPSRTLSALAPDPAHATVTVAADGGVSISVFTCQSR